MTTHEQNVENAVNLLDICRSKALTLATAESCTGGLLGAILTAPPGASAVYLGGFITYANSAKIALLQVDPAALAQFGAVSEQVAGQMAMGARRATGADLAVSITGIAGPGGSDHKPEGRVCFGLASPGGMVVERVEFGPLGRENIRRAACAKAVDMLVLAAQGA